MYSHVKWSLGEEWLIMYHFILGLQLLNAWKACLIIWVRIQCWRLCQLSMHILDVPWLISQMMSNSTHFRYVCILILLNHVVLLIPFLEQKPVLEFSMRDEICLGIHSPFTRRMKIYAWFKRKNALEKKNRDHCIQCLYLCWVFSQLMDVLISMYPAALRLEIFKLTQNFLDLISTYGTSGKRALKVSHNTLCWNMWNSINFCYNNFVVPG